MQLKPKTDMGFLSVIFSYIDDIIIATPFLNTALAFY